MQSAMLVIAYSCKNLGADGGKRALTAREGCRCGGGSRLGRSLKAFLQASRNFSQVYSMNKEGRKNK